MSLGKVAAQVGHAVHHAVMQSRRGAGGAMSNVFGTFLDSTMPISAIFE